MTGKYKSKVLAGLLSLFMVLGVIISPLAGAAEADDTPKETIGNIDIDVPRNENDALEDAKPRQFRYFRVSENEYTQDELNELYRKVDAMSMEDVIKEYGEGELSDYSEVTELEDGKSYDSFKLRNLPAGAYVLKETEESAADHQYKMVAIAWNSQEGVYETQKVVDKVYTSKKPLILNKIAIDNESDDDEVVKLEGVVFKLIDLDNEENPAISLYETDQAGVYSYSSENNEPVEELLTNSDGQIIVNDLPEGNYKFTEISTIDDYVIIDGEEDTEEFLYKPSIGKELDKQNSKSPEKRTLHLIKVDGDDDKPLAGVEFKLYVNVGDVSYPVGVDANGEYYIEDKAENKNEDLNYIFKTDDQGNIILNDLPELPENGTYEFREVKTLDGYVLVDDKTHQAEFGKTVRVKNYKNPTPIDIKLTKVDSYNGNPLDKVGFELYRVKVEEKDNGRLENVTERVGLTGEAGSYQFDETAAQSSLEYQLYTNTNGEISVSNLPDGDYYFKENEPLEAYDTEENNGKESLRLDRENNTYEMKNKPKVPGVYPPDSDRKGKGGFRFVKVDDSKDQNRLAGATFALYSVNEKGENVPYEVGGKRVTLKSGSNGEFEVKNLPVGNYILRETAAPNGYILDVNPIKFEITKDSYSKDAIMIVNKKNPDKTVTPPVVRPPSRTNPPTTTRTVRSPRTYYVPKDKPGVPRGPLVKTGDIRIVILIGLGLLMIIGGLIIVNKDEKNQKISLA